MVLVQRALSVLYQLSVGVTIVHAGSSYTPRLMCSGRLLLESEIIQRLLCNPNPGRFPLLLKPAHGRARTFLMATLSKLLFTQSRYSISSATNHNGSQQVQHTLVAAVRAVRAGQVGAAAVLDKLDSASAATALRGMSAPERGEAFFVMFMQPLSE